MSDRHDELRQTLDRIHTLIATSGRARDEVLNPVVLARATALTVADVETLLGGGTVADDDIDQRVRARLHTLYLARIAETGKRPADIRQEIADHIERSPEWVRRLCNGEKTPSVRDLFGLRDYYGITGSQWVVTAPAASAVNEVLKGTLRVLEAAEDNLLARVMRDFDEVLIPHRGRALTETEKTVITSYVTAILNDPA